MDSSVAFRFRRAAAFCRFRRLQWAQLRRRQFPEPLPGQVEMFGPRQPVFPEVTAAGTRDALPEVAGPDVDLVPAVAAAAPGGVPADVLRAAEHRQHSEALARQIESLCAVAAHAAPPPVNNICILSDRLAGFMSF